MDNTWLLALQQMDPNEPGGKYQAQMQYLKENVPPEEWNAAVQKGWITQDGRPLNIPKMSAPGIDNSNWQSGSTKYVDQHIQGRQANGTYDDPVYGKQTSYKNPEKTNEWYFKYGPLLALGPGMLGAAAGAGLLGSAAQGLVGGAAAGAEGGVAGSIYGGLGSAGGGFGTEIGGAAAAGAAGAGGGVPGSIYGGLGSAGGGFGTEIGGAAAAGAGGAGSLGSAGGAILDSGEVGLGSLGEAGAVGGGTSAAQVGGSSSILSKIAEQFGVSPSTAASLLKAIPSLAQLGGSILGGKIAGNTVGNAVSADTARDDARYQSNVALTHPNQTNAFGDTSTWSKDANGNWNQEQKLSAPRQQLYDTQQGIAQSNADVAKGIDMSGYSDPNKKFATASANNPFMTKLPSMGGNLIPWDYKSQLGG